MYGNPGFDLDLMRMLSEMQQDPVLEQLNQMFPGQYDWSQLSPVERQLSLGQNARSSMEEAAFKENRPDLFINQAINNPQMAPLYTQKAALTGRETERKGAEEAFYAQQAQQAHDKQVELTSQLLPSLGPQMASEFARKMMSGGQEQFTPEDVGAWQNVLYQQQLKDWKAKQQEFVAQSMKGATVSKTDPMGNEINVPVFQLSPKEQMQAQKYFENAFGAAPAGPSPLPTISQPQGGGSIEARPFIDPKTGKKTFQYFNTPASAGPSASAPVPTTGTAIEGPPVPPGVRPIAGQKEKGEALKESQTAAEKETAMDYLSRVAGAGLQGAMEPFRNIGSVFSKPISEVTPTEVFRAATSPATGYHNALTGALSNAAVEAFSPAVPKAPVAKVTPQQRLAQVNQKLLMGAKPQDIAKELDKDKSIPEAEKAQLMLLLQQHMGLPAGIPPMPGMK